jgi:hypothetical protein
MLAWVLSIPALTIFAVRSWSNESSSRLSTWRKVLGIASSAELSLSWLSFIVLSFLGQIGGFGSHFMTTRLADPLLLLSLLAVLGSVALKSSPRLAALGAGVLLTALWFGSEMVA